MRRRGRRRMLAALALVRRNPSRSCGGSAPRSCGGGGGRFAAGGSPGQTSRTRHGAWSTTKRARRAEALGPEPLVVAVAGEHEQVGAHARGDDLALDAPVAHLRRRLAAEALARVGQERAGGVVGDLVPARAARGGGGARAARPRRRAATSSSSADGTARSAMSASAGASAAAVSTHASHPASVIHTTTRIRRPAEPTTARASRRAGSAAPSARRGARTRRCRCRGRGRGARAARAASRASRRRSGSARR